MFLLSGLPGHLLRRPHCPANGVAPQAVGTAVGLANQAGGNPRPGGKPMSFASLGRRRAITLLGAFAGLPLLASDRRTSDPTALYQWQGTSLGSPSRLLLYHPSQAATERIVALC